MDLIRRILEFIEGCDHEHDPRGLGFMPTTDDIANGSSIEEIRYHVRLCADAMLVRMTDKSWRLKELTWAGHEMLDQIRSRPSSA